MKPISLTISAFGPFCKSMTLNFEDLKEHNLFLIAGPTGAGKTTILDAMVFALFGETSGGLRSGQTMRSDYADEATPTVVEFTFSIGEQKYRIERQPKQELKKRRGSGTRWYEATAILWIWQDDGWQEYSSRSTEISNKIQEILGFRVNQFLQVVLLPQGEFRKLLVANTAEREALMHSLFKTDIFKRLQEELKAEYDQVVASAKTVIDRQQYLLQSEQVDSYKGLKDALTERKQGLSESETQLTTLKQNYEDVTKAYDNNVKREQLSNELKVLQAQESELIAKQDGMNEVATIVKQLTAYEPIVLHKKRLNELSVEEDSLHKELSNLAESLQSILAEQAKLADEHAQLQQREETRKAYETVLQEAVKIQQKIGEAEILDRELATDKATLKSEESKLNAKRSDLENRRTMVNEMEQTVATLRDETAREGALLNEQTLWKDALRYVEAIQQALTQLQKADSDLQRAKLALVESQTKELQAKSELQLARAQAVQQQAAHLAEHLEAGMACPVCGSTEHPYKATYVDDFNADLLEEKEKSHEAAVRRVSAAEVDVESATKQQELRTQELESTVRAYTDWQAQQDFKELQTYKESDDWNRLALEFEEHRDAVEPVLKQIHVKQNQLQRTESQLTENRNLLNDAEQAVTEGQNAYTDRAKELAVKQTRFDVLQSELPKGDLDAWQADLNEKEDWLTTHNKALDDNEGARLKNSRAESACTADTQNKNQRIAKVQEELQHTAALYEEALGKASLSEARMSELNNFIDKKEELEQQLKTYNDDCVKVKTQLKNNEDALQALPPVDAAATAERKQAVTEQYEAALQDLAVQGERINKLEQTINEYDELVQNNMEITKKSDFLYRLSDMANGGQTGLRGVTFELYVLGAILEEVVNAANLRLRQMSRSRYELQRTAVEGLGRGHRGLDLSVLDNYTGVARPANTLSGGETFLASLSLAMGLADVIQAYAGGIHLDTIFIDEGFGTLDPDSLDIAMESLVELQASGRLVGIISHVPELRARISAHLEVQPVEQGSVAKFVVP